MTYSGRTTYLIVAILVSPIFGVFLESITRDIFLLFTIDFKSWIHNIPVFITSGFGKAIFGLFVSLPVVVLYGIPVFYALKKWNLQKVWMYSLFGLFPTTIGMLVSLYNHNGNLENINMSPIILSALDGLFIAIIFWFIAVYLPLRKSDKIEL